MKDVNLGFDKLGLENLPSLHTVTGYIYCAAEVEEAEEALSYAAAVHPNRPTLQMRMRYEDDMLSSDDEQGMGALQMEMRNEVGMLSSDGQVPTFLSGKVVDGVVNVREEKDKSHLFNFCRLLRNPCVEKFSVCIKCDDATVGEVEEAEAALRFAVDVHRNHPTLEITRCGEDKMMLSEGR